MKSYDTCDHANWYWFNLLDYVRTTIRWFCKTKRRKNDLTTAYSLRRSPVTVVAVINASDLRVRACGRTSQRNGRLDPRIHRRQDWYTKRRCQGNAAWNYFRYFVLDVWFQGIQSSRWWHNGTARCVRDIRLIKFCFNLSNELWRLRNFPRRRLVPTCFRWKWLFIPIKRLFLLLLSGKFPWPVVFDWFVGVWKLVKFVNKSLPLNLRKYRQSKLRIYISKNEAIRVSFLIESQVIWGFFIS